MTPTADLGLDLATGKVLYKDVTVPVASVREQYNNRFARETFDRALAVAANALPASATIVAQPILLNAGDVITNLSLCTNSTAATFGSNADGHAWLAIYDNAGNLLRQTADLVGATWTANTVVTAPLSSAYTVPTTDVYFAVLGFQAGTGGAPATPTVVGRVLPSAAIQAAMNAIVPGTDGLCKFVNQAVAAAAPATIAAISAAAAGNFNTVSMWMLAS